ncbi:protein translocase subunit SecDF [Desulfotalea psychrophila]|uniref:Multifunctional fusion protein n=1 Tax=Desulfotalea psychrophila (strain LSv54 / DSM 12343) TaxID=177439 RepID=Q6AQ38_DESPS|nr:protein translocase subunit SecDF [Desulfotalea psychrophila]CAG35535.1 related to protein-export membrane protein SecD [Desulfotalea psychrophila LSv54]
MTPNIKKKSARLPMKSKLKIKLVLLFCLVCMSGITLMPSFYSSTPDWWKKYMAPEGLRLGLDLQGGMHLVLKVNLPKAEENALQFAANDLKDTLAEESISAVRTPSGQADTIVFTLPNASAIGKVKTIIDSEFPNINVRIDNKEGSFPRIALTLTQEKKDFIYDNAVNQSLEIIRNRIDQFGVAEPVIIRQGNDEIVIQLPGVKDPKRALKLLGDTAQLEFKVVSDTPGVNLRQIINQARDTKKWQDGEDTVKLNRAIESLLPEGTSIYFEKDIDPKTGKEIVTPLLLENKVLMTGDMIKDAQVRIGGTFNEPYVSLDMTGRGGRVFAKITEQNVGRRMAIVLDNVVRSAPVIRERIIGGSAQISGSFSHEDAADLAIVLRVGALPAPVDIIQNVTVGASLGQDSINKGLYSGLFGTLLVLIFMAIYYRLSGVIANTALFLNILLLFTGLAILNATLTLPGIAGIILSIGMAVDSNVLIFERMRDEYTLGKSVRASINAGFDKAFWTIVDSQVTTLITAMALFLFGTGPIKGFAITLSLGIIFNLFTALFFSRTMFETINSIRPMKTLKFMELVKRPSIDYLSLRKISFTISTVMVIIGLFAVIQIGRGAANLGVDFSGGSLLQYKVSSDFSMSEVRNAFKGTPLEGANLQEVENEHQLMIKLKKSDETVANLSEQADKILGSKITDKTFTLESQSEIGSSVSAVLRDKAILAIVISMVGVILYLALRFDFRFGLAAAAATFHDVLVVLGLCWLMNIEITLLIVTALLTLAGYSLNDSVVVFDRIRENTQKADKHDSFFSIINNSVNQVISRTIIVSLTTVLVLLVLFLMGGPVIHDFSFTLLIGIIVGTYSSIFIASPLLTIKKKA